MDTSVNPHVYTAHATDRAGNTSLATRSYIMVKGCNRVDVAVILHGAWNGTPVDAYVGGTRQETLFSAPDAFGRQAVLWTFSPPRCSDEKWSVRVAPQLPAGLEGPRWQYRLIQVETRDAGSTPPLEAAVTIEPCQEYVLHFQLVDTGVAPEAGLTGGGSSASSGGGALEIPLLAAPAPQPVVALEPAAQVAEVVLSRQPVLSVPPEPAAAADGVAAPGLAQRIAGLWQALLEWLRGLFAR